MLYADRIYGRVKIREPIILEIINSATFQRLKGIDQSGYAYLYCQLQSLRVADRATRFEHSIGVFLLLKKYQVSLEEQIAGLIHDLSHTAFSHCIDYALDDGSPKTQDYQDKIHDQFVRNSEIAPIIKKHHLDLNYILDEENFPLKEKPLPGLCADRIDYSLRDGVDYQVINQAKVDYFLEHLVVENDLWVFKDQASARQYGEMFRKLNIKHYAGLPTAITFQTVGALLRHALDQGYLKQNDLFTTNQQVIAKIKKKIKTDQRLKLLWQRMNNQVKFRVDPKDYHVHVFCKSRIVDPLFKIKGRVQRLSAADKSWAKVVQEESVPKEYFIWFEK